MEAVDEGRRPNTEACFFFAEIKRHFFAVEIKAFQKAFLRARACRLLR